MNIAGIGGLMADLKFSFGLPLFFFGLALVNIRLSSRRKYAGLKLRVSLVFSIALFACLLCTLLFQDRSVLGAIWNDNPVLFSSVYATGSALVLAGIAGVAYWKLRPALWRGNDTEAET